MLFSSKHRGEMVPIEDATNFRPAIDSHRSDVTREPTIAIGFSSAAARDGLPTSAPANGSSAGAVIKRGQEVADRSPTKLNTAVAGAEIDWSLLFWSARPSGDGTKFDVFLWVGQHDATLITFAVERSRYKGLDLCEKTDVFRVRGVVSEVSPLGVIHLEEVTLEKLIPSNEPHLSLGTGWH